MVPGAAACPHVGCVGRETNEHAFKIEVKADEQTLMNRRRTDRLTGGIVKQPRR